jgi:2-oxo-4-hydroxy-4-carboxy--5-ureidoimidazoline (OHCU) decarboxylase
MTAPDPFPPMSELDRWSSDAFKGAVVSLFEGAPSFVDRVALDRPYGTDAQLFDRARTIARTMPQEEQVLLLNAHPRIGAPSGSVSAQSYREQGYGASTTGDAAAIQAELDRLNAAYEAQFGFRFVVFVNGRPQSVIAQVLSDSLGADRENELQRGLDAVVDIAADRLQRLRGRG